MLVDIVKTSRKTLRSLRACQDMPTLCEPMLRALLPMDDTDLRIQVNMREIHFELDESPTMSVVIQAILTSLLNLRVFRQAFEYQLKDPKGHGTPARTSSNP
ncbi:hypothetical protein MVEG_09313 [Podila verticillata NRRL 6337]|nr:hypothetical protein MVEG_09313 [Podila verticillata NRRL 6337]